MSFPNFTYSENCRSGDPINIIFQNISIPEITKFLVGELNWIIPKLDYFALTHFIPFPSSIEKTEQTIQFINDDSYSGLKDRYHIRIWDISQIGLDLHSWWDPTHTIIAGIHLDKLRFSGMDVSTDFEAAENDFANICRKNSNWIIFPNKIDLQNAFYGYDQPRNNGFATLISGSNI